MSSSEVFRFATKHEYEVEIEKVIFFKNKKKRRGEELPGYDRENIEEDYDNLVEEYLRFCTDKDG